MLIKTINGIDVVCSEKEELDIRAEWARVYVPTSTEVKANRHAAYVAESDPLFFKAQRGEATQEEWLAKIAEIKNRFPDPNEEAQA